MYNLKLVLFYSSKTIQIQQREAVMLEVLLRNLSIILLVILGLLISQNNPKEETVYTPKVESQPVEPIENQTDSIAKIEFGWNKVNHKGVTHYEVFYGNKGEFTHSKLVLSPPSDEKMVHSGELKYPKNEVIVAGVRSCTAKGCSDMNGLLVEGFGAYEKVFSNIEYKGKTYNCEILFKDNHGYVLVYYGKSEPSLWDKVFYFEKKDDGETELKEFFIGSEEKNQIPI